MVVEVVRADDRHIEALAEFYRAVWDAGATPDSVRRARAADDNVPTFLFLQGGKALGHVTTIPVRVRCHGRERAGHWIKGLMVLPEHRNGPVGMLVLKEAVRQLGLQLAMVVADAPRRLFGALGFRDLGALRNWIRPLRPGRVVARMSTDFVPGGSVGRAVRGALRMAQATGLAHVAGAAAGALAGAWREVAGRVPAGVTLEPVGDGVWSEVEALWHRVAASFPATTVRDARALRQRYGRPGGTYRMIAARAAGQLRGVAAIRAPRDEGDARLAGLRVATLSDALFDPSDARTGLALLAGAESAGRDLDADALLCSASDARLAPLLSRRAFLPIGGNVHFALRDSGADAPAYPTALGAWWLWRGDSSADEVF